MVLDADQIMENLLDDEATLRLDGTIYNNVARFLNHCVANIFIQENVWYIILAS
jgi:hypothetical protein